MQKNEKLIKKLKIKKYLNNNLWNALLKTKFLKS